MYNLSFFYKIYTFNNVYKQKRKLYLVFDN